MKAQILICILFLAALISGCASTPSDLQPATATLQVMPRLDPSPTPSGSTLPLTCQVTDLKVYINEMDRYCFAYPMRFTLGDRPSDRPDIHGPILDNGLEPVAATFGVDVTPAAADQTVREQAEAYLKDYTHMDSAAWTQVQVGGETGWMVEPIPTVGAWRMVFVQHNDSLFRLAYWPVDIDVAKADVDELTQTTLGSFAFLKYKADSYENDT